MLIGITGKRRAGKGTVALRLSATRGFAIEKFADPIKAMLLAVGLTEEEIEGDLKECPNEVLMGQTPRFGMQTVGDWGRQVMGERMWMAHWERRALARLRRGEPVIVDDVRLPAEADLVRGHGGIIIGVHNPRVSDGSDGHLTETAMDGIVPDHWLVNDASRETLWAATDALMRCLDRRRPPAGAPTAPEPLAMGF